MRVSAYYLSPSRAAARYTPDQSSGFPDENTYGSHQFSRVSRNKDMKKPQPLENGSTNNTRNSKRINPKKRTRVVTRVRSKAPASTSPEIPILYTLLGTPETWALARDVLKEVGSAKWFSELDDDDRKARYPKSKKKIVDSVIKFAKKNLVLKGQVFPPGKDAPLGTWKITRKGSERAAMYGSSWSPKYSVHDDAIIIENEK